MFPNLQIFKHSSLADDGKEKAIIPRDSYSQQWDFWQVSRPCLITLYANNHYELSDNTVKNPIAKRIISLPLNSPIKRDLFLHQVPLEHCVFRHLCVNP